MKFVLQIHLPQMQLFFLNFTLNCTIGNISTLFEKRCLQIDP